MACLSAVKLWPGVEEHAASFSQHQQHADGRRLAILRDLGPVADVGQPFAVAGGLNGKQGMLLAVLRDMLAGCAVVAATTHLKAKAGQVGWLPHQACIGIAQLRPVCTQARPSVA